MDAKKESNINITNSSSVEKGDMKECCQVSSKNSATKRLLSILFYGFTTLSLVLVNKGLFNICKFPSPALLGLFQCSVTVTILLIAVGFKIFRLPKIDTAVVFEVLPIAVCFCGNLIMGFMATKYVSIPMFTTLRRCSLPLSMCLQYFILHSKPKKWSYFTVSIIILGTAIAIFRDFTFTLIGYASMFAYNFSTSLETVFLKRSLNKAKLTRMQLVFLCSTCSLLPLTLLNVIQNDFIDIFQTYDQWTEPLFVVLFSMCMVLGLALNYSVVLCNDYTSPVTLQVVSQLRMSLLTYIGIFFGGDYTFDIVNMVGINLCLVGGLIHTYLSIKTEKPEPTITDSDKINNNSIAHSVKSS